MSRRFGIIILGVVLTAIISAEQQPTFRSNVDVITVNVSVRDGGKAVAGLKAADFRLTDNGVAQTISQSDFEFEAIPVDATLVLDTSGSTVTVVEQFKKDAREIARLLRAFDRIRLLVVDTHVYEIFSMRSAGENLPLERLPGGGLSSVYDALVAALIAPSDPDRRRLVVAMTDGLDTYSSVVPDTLLQVAPQSDAVLHILLTGVSARTGGPQMPVIEGADASSDLRSPKSRPSTYWDRDFKRAAWGPFQPLIRAAYFDLDVDMLRQASAVTGGELHAAGFFGGGAVNAFRGVFDDFKASYLLRFSPSGVTRGGWHEIGVTLPRFPNLTIRGRTGYHD